MSSDGPFGSDTEIGVGFSDTLLLAVSVVGFLMLAGALYSIFVLHTNSEKDADKEGREEGDYDAFLVNADVTKLSRAERRARARAIMKQERRADADDEGEDQQGAEGRAVSRKERQLRAKALEREERRRCEEERKEIQKAEREQAQREKKERELRKEEEKREREAIQKAKEESEREQYLTFLASPAKTQSVDEWISELRQKRVVSLEDTATSFELQPDDVKSRIRELIAEGRVGGIIRDDSSFQYFSDEELKAIALAVRTKGEATTAEIAELVEGIQR